MSQNTKSLSLTVKFLPPILGGTLIALLIGTGFLFHTAKISTDEQTKIAQTSLQTEQHHAETARIKALESKADIIGKFMAKTAPDLILGFDFTALKDYQEQASKDPDVAYTAYLKPDGATLTTYTAPKDKSKIIEKQYPIALDGQQLGSVLIGMSKASLTNDMNESNDRISSAIEKVSSSGQTAIHRLTTIMVVDILFVMVFISGILYKLFRVFVVNPLKETTQLVEGLAQGGGDLAVELPISFKDEIGCLRQSVNMFMAQLRSMISTIAMEVSYVSNASLELRETSQDQSQNANTQLRDTSQVATAMHQMTASTQEVATSASSAAGAAQDTDDAAINGKQVVSQTIEDIDRLATEVERASEVIHRLERDAESIGSVLDVIKGIAEQTNLLALNAAIEAARAGEQGRGFAVVADEVRTLASRTQQSTLEIQETINRLQNETQNAVSAMNEGRRQANSCVTQAAKARDALEIITRSVATIRDMNNQIASAAEEQTTMSEEVNRNIISINSTAEQVASKADQSANSSDELANLAARLQTLIGQFKT